jgi:hypothetical protein
MVEANMNPRLPIYRAALLVAAGALSACSLASPPPEATPDMAMMPMPPPGPEPDMAMPPAATLPFAVDTAFAPSGFMGDGQMTGAITMLPAKMGDSRDCDGQRGSSTAVGICHTITYTPPTTGGMGWAGVYWQYPSNNWGTKAGFPMPPGATKVTFQAKGAKGGEIVKFLAGGIINAGSPYTDSVKATVSATLTTSWAPYTIDLTGQSYAQVIGGFGWTMAAMDAGTSGTFYVDDIQWQ